MGDKDGDVEMRIGRESEVGRDEKWREIDMGMDI